MSYYQLGEITVTDEQKQRIATYLELIGHDPNASNDEDEQRLTLGILEAFNNDPLVAAQRYKDAGEKAQAAMLEHSNKMIEQVPFPEQENFFLRFDTIEEGQAYWEKVKIESIKVSNAVFGTEFYDLVTTYHEEQMKKAQSLQ